MEYLTKKWTIAGEFTFPDNYLKLLNPSMTVSNVTITQTSMLSLNLMIKENNGVYNHMTNVNWTIPAELTDVNDIVNAAMVATLPTATVSNI